MVYGVGLGVGGSGLIATEGAVMGCEICLGQW